MADEREKAATGAEAPVGSTAPERRDGVLTREAMEAEIKAGRGVVFRGTVITKLEDLPSDADLVRGGAEQADAARARLMAQRDRLDAEMRRLDALEVTPTRGTQAPAAPKADEGHKGK